jgi:hypothetical protein
LLWATFLGHDRDAKLVLIRSQYRYPDLMMMGQRLLPTLRAPLFVCLLGLGLADCSSLPDISQVSMPKTNFDMFSPENWTPYSGQGGRKLRPVAAEDLVDGSGHCAGGAPVVPASTEDATASAEPTAPSGARVGLDMTECDVVRASGQPQNVEVSANERGERSVVMTYATVERSGTYRFTAGRLTSIERGPDIEPPPKPKKSPPKKQARKQAT